MKCPECGSEKVEEVSLATNWCRECDHQWTPAPSQPRDGGTGRMGSRPRGGHGHGGRKTGGG